LFATPDIGIERAKEGGSIKPKGMQMKGVGYLHEEIEGAKRGKQAVAMCTGVLYAVERWPSVRLLEAVRGLTDWC
jgi:hypothetical protein